MSKRTPLAWLFAIAGLLAAPAARADDAADFFEAKVRPLLAEHCLPCHGDDEKKGGLALTSRQAVLDGGGGGPAAEPGEPRESYLIDVLSHEDEPRMPPKGKLKDEQIETLRKWVEMGLPWGEEAAAMAGGKAKAAQAGAPHWAFQPVADPVPPTVIDAEWALNPIDLFILSRLEGASLSPAPEADRRTLIRRLAVDLTGLPPTYEEVEAFAADPAPDAYERLVDRLLASPHAGEKAARGWLDLARYSDTKGYVYAREEGRWVHAWLYRDWVVRAMNEDLPYDRFLTLQLAADQAAERPEDLAAMGFLTLGRRFLGVTHDIIDDRIDVVTRATMGLTVSCARCHDHKFDPIPTTDYYSLYGVFKSSTERLVPATDSTPTDGETAAGLAERQAKLAERVAADRKATADRARARIHDYLMAQLELHKYPEEGFDQILSETDLIPATVRRWRDTIARAKAAPTPDPILGAWVAFASLKPDEFAAMAPGVCQALSSEGFAHPTIVAAFASPPADMAEVARRYAEMFKPFVEAPPADEADPIRLFLFGPDSPCEVPDEPIVESESYLPTPAIEAIWRLQGDIDRWLISRGDSPPYAAILADRKYPADARVFRRGNPATPGDTVPRRFLTALGATPFEAGSGRLELARAIADPANPLTARVAVNRLWRDHFGAGLVATPGDFGTRAEAPSHPELLDWLASRFVESGWSLKEIRRLIVTSATYRQSSAVRPSAEALASDPTNRLLWRYSPRRLTFEELRDAFLFASGELDASIGGRAADLFRAPFPARRTLYGQVDRGDLPGVLRSFDFPNADLLVPQRSETTVPQQALFLLNHPLLLGRAEALVRRAGDGEKARALYRLALGREPSAAEEERALAMVRAEEAEPAEDDVPAGARAWQHGYGRFDEATGKVAGFTPLPHFAGDAWQGGPSWPDGALGWARLEPAGGHPGNDLDHAVVLRWVAPADAVVRVSGVLKHEPAEGDGVRAFVATSRAGMLRKEAVHHGEKDLGVESIEVVAGEAIDFVVDIGGSLAHDQYLWEPVVEVVSAPGAIEGPNRWSGRDDFHGPAPEPLGPWEKLAQVLLLSNEFTFVD